jgi:release factor glutamine methyltransferase
MTANQRHELAARLRAAGCVFAEDEADILLAAAATPAELAAMTERRVIGDPLEHIVGWADFAGLRVVVGTGVFVPRRRTEFLVEQAASLLAPGAVVVDLCSGSGAVGAALLSRADNLELYAVEIDPVMADYARRNLGNRGQVIEGDLFDPLPDRLRGRVDVVVANAPYVPTEAIAQMPPEARDHEPLVALDGGPDGLDIHRRIAAGATDWLSPGGQLLIEVGERQAPIAMAFFTAAGLVPRGVGSEDHGTMVVIGQRPA